MFNRGGFNRFKFNSQTATVVANGAITLGLRYCIVTKQSVTKSATYSIGTPAALALGATYHIRKTTTQTRPAQYVITSAPITLIQLQASYVMDVYPYYEGTDPYIICRCCPDRNPYNQADSPFGKDNKPFTEATNPAGPTRVRKYNDATAGSRPKQGRTYTPFIDL